MGFYKMEKRTKNLLVLSGVGAGVYYISKNLFNKDNNQQDYLLGGSSGSGNGGAISDLLNNGGLTGNQATLLKKQITTGTGSSTLDTYDFNGLKGYLVTTSVQNQNLISRNAGTLAGTNTFIAYRNDAGSILGGSDFKHLQSVTAERAQNTKKNFKVSAVFDKINSNVKSSFNKKFSSSSTSNKSSSRSSTKKNLKTDSLSGKDKGKGTYIVTTKDGSKVKRYYR